MLAAFTIFRVLNPDGSHLRKHLSQHPSSPFSCPESLLLIRGNFLTACDFSASIRSQNFFWVPPPPPTKLFSLALPMASLSPPPWEFPQPSLSSIPILIQPSKPSLVFGLWSPWPLCTTFGSPPTSQATSFQLPFPVPCLLTLNGSSSSWF